MNRIARFAALVCALVAVSCQNEERATSPSSNTTPVAFRYLGSGGSTIPSKPDVVAIRVWADDTVLLVDNRYDWGAGEAELQVPLHRPLRFEVRGIRRRDSRDLLLWTATGRDTLDDVSAEIPLVTMQTAAADTSAPNLLGAQTGSGAVLVVLDAISGTMALSLPAGSNSGVVSIPDSLADSLYVHGVADSSVDGFWKIRMGRSDTATIVLVGSNGAVATWKLEATTRDLSPIALDVRLDDGATSGTRGDTLVFTLPYVVDSTPHLVFAPKIAADRPDSIAFDGQELSKSAAEWSKAVAVPGAGTGNGALHRIFTEDSVGNRAEHLVLVERSKDARAPQLAWATAPGPESLGVHEARFVLRVVGGDSLRTPAFASKGLATASIGRLPLRREGDTTWWSGSVSLLADDAGSIVATVSNILGTSWALDTARITRFDPRGPDSTAPGLRAADGTFWTRTGSSTVVTGSAWDERRGDVVVLVAHSGRTDTASWSKSDSSWSWTLAWSGDGDTTISVVAVDSAGNTSAATPIRVVRDTKSPSLSWSASFPAARDTFVTGMLSATVALDVADEPHLRGAYAFADGASDTLQMGALGGTQWARSISFRNGWNVWIFGAIDSAGNRMEKVLHVLADDTSGISMTVSVNNGASMSRSGDTLVFALPYVVDSALSATLRISPSDDRPSSLKWGAKPLEVGSSSSWSIPLPVPSTGAGGGVIAVVAASDSLGNTSQLIVRIVRDTNAASPTVSWATPPADKPWGAMLDSFVLLVVGGDSLKAPVFASEAFANGLSPVSRLRTGGDSVWWSGSASLVGKDSGMIVARVENLLGQAWTSSQVFVHRYDPAGPDETPAKLTVDPVPGNGWTSSASVTLRGKASDARSGWTRVLVKAVSGRVDTAAWSQLDSSWSAVVGLSADVDTTVSVYAVDSAGNASAPQVVRIRRDRAKPGFAWTTVPAISGDTLRTRNTMQTLSVTCAAADLRGIRAVRSTTKDTLSFGSPAAGAWTVDAYLPQGWSTWSVVATDSAGNDSLRILKVLRDSIAPKVSWSVSGTIPEGKYAVSARRDTLWLSSDTTVALTLASTTGLAGVSVPDPDADSGSATRKAIQSLPLRQNGGTSTTWVFHAVDELGNASRPESLVVVGLAPVAMPVAKAGSSVVALAAGGALPWPKTVHYSCPDPDATIQGIKADMPIQKSISMTATCKLGKLRSSSRTFSWSIADTGSVPVPRAYVDSSKLSVAVDASGRLWMMVANNATALKKGYATLFRSSLSPDTGYWQDHDSRVYAGATRVVTARGIDGSGLRYHAVVDSATSQAVYWTAATPGAPTISSPAEGIPDVAGIYVQGDHIQFRLGNNAGSGLVLSNLASGTVLDTIIPSGVMKEFRDCATQSSSAFVFFGTGTRVPFGLWSLSGNRTALSYTFPFVASSLEFAASPKSESFFVVGRDRGTQDVFAYKFASPAATSPSYSSTLLASSSLTAPVSAVAWEGGDLWIATGSTLYRFSEDLSSHETFVLPATILGRPEPDPTGGVWVVANNSRVYHVRGSAQD